MPILSIVHVDLSPGLENKFADSVGSSLREILTNNFLSWSNFFKKFPEYSLCFYIVTKKGVEEVEIKGPGIFKKNTEVEYSIFLPEKADNVISYIDAIFEGLSKILKNYEIEKNKIDEMKKQLLELLNL